MAPEIVKRTEYDGKPVDIWSMGIFLYALLCGCFPFRAKSYPDLYRRIARGTFQIPDELSPNVKDILGKLLEVDVDKRITSHAALRHPWLQISLATAPDINKLRLETPILVSDKASDDLDEETLQELMKFGIPREDLIRLVMSKVHSSITTVYYLLLDLVKKRRKLTNKKPIALNASSSGSTNKRPSSANASSRASNQVFAQQPASNPYLAANGTTNITSTGINLTNAQAVATGDNTSTKISGVMQQLAQAKLQYSGNMYVTGPELGQTQRPRSASTGRTAGQRPLSAGAGRR
jgi:serine/threonine protein kinase